MALLRSLWVCLEMKEYGLTLRRVVRNDHGIESDDTIVAPVIFAYVLGW
ncbi:MAG: hypothetical protein JSS39_03725 [Nitrospira sp.]|nr:hypothetical protein [Nitrospira sp.]